MLPRSIRFLLGARAMRPFAACLLSLCFVCSTPLSQEIAVAQDAQAQDVPHPKLPKGAGAVDADAPKTFTATGSGLRYRVLRKGEGVNPKATNTVKVHYHGWLDNEQVFDSSYNRGEPIEFPLNRVIPGWTEGMQLVGEGGMIELWIPSDLGYGKSGTPGGPIPPDATLHFLVELLDVR
jgi:FKBP-type peptidyl-prolyl cis-trans isomerase FkpA